jgi:hypothetical protein
VANNAVLTELICVRASLARLCDKRTAAVAGRAARASLEDLNIEIIWRPDEAAWEASKQMRTNYVMSGLLRALLIVARSRASPAARTEGSALSDSARKIGSLFGTIFSAGANHKCARFPPPVRECQDAAGS